MKFDNVYEDAKRAESYAGLEFPGTYYLAYRDLPKIVAEHVTGIKALDFGCGTGRSTRFLKRLGFDVTGIDISEAMIAKARELDPSGNYCLVADGDLSSANNKTYDLILSVFTFDNIPTMTKKVKLLFELKKMLAVNGKIINLVSSRDIYVNEWASFTTKDFPENRCAQSGDKVRIVMTDVEDRRPVEDIVWFHEAYCDTYGRADLKITKMYKPLGKSSEPFNWVSETRIAPWVIYVLQ
jgi:SAM-dependent methyltransferase